MDLDRMNRKLEDIRVSGRWVVFVFLVGKRR